MMKFLLIFFIFMVLLWQWRNRHSDTDTRPERKAGSVKKPAQPTTMVACAHCGLHVPAEDAITGNQGTYCSVAHRQLRES